MSHDEQPPESRDELTRLIAGELKLLAERFPQLGESKLEALRHAALEIASCYASLLNQRLREKGMKLSSNAGPAYVWGFEQLIFATIEHQIANHVEQIPAEHLVTADATFEQWRDKP